MIGITPACAGKTSPFLKFSSRAEDHPRMCGKDFILIIRVFYVAGSPPHVRERRDFGLPQARKRRITPACAGKTEFRPIRHLSEWDHPRMCGKD